MMTSLQCCPFHPHMLSKSSKKQRKPLNGYWKKEQNDKEKELEKLIAELELTKQPTEEARKLAELSQYIAEAAKEASSPDGQGTVQPLTDPKNFVLLPNGTFNSHKGDKEQPLQKALPVKLKGVDLSTFSGEDKTDYGSWKASFMSIVDWTGYPCR